VEVALVVLAATSLEVTEAAVLWANFLELAAAVVAQKILGMAQLAVRVEVHLRATVFQVLADRQFFKGFKESKVFVVETLLVLQIQTTLALVAVEHLHKG
jgi:hypothetical protein